jgi:hypothetical protein
MPKPVIEYSRLVMTGNCVPQAKPGLLGLLVCKNERTLPGLVRQETAYRACRYRDVKWPPERPGRFKGVSPALRSGIQGDYSHCPLQIGNGRGRHPGGGEWSFLY